MGKEAEFHGKKRGTGTGGEGRKKKEAAFYGKK
jgi:hypothetical protein